MPSIGHTLVTTLPEPPKRLQMTRYVSPCKAEVVGSNPSSSMTRTRRLCGFSRQGRRWRNMTGDGRSVCSSRGSGTPPKEFGEVGDDEVRAAGVERLPMAVAGDADHEPESGRARGGDPGRGGLEGRAPPRLYVEPSAGREKGVG
jgi:hypothetical protein